jgi:type III secretory pathway component EscV
VEPDQALAEEAWKVLALHAGELVGLAETQALLAGMAPAHQAALRELVPGKVEPRLLAEVLRRLLAEEVSVRNLPDILEALASASDRGPSDSATLTERVRNAALRRWLSRKYGGENGRVEALLLDGQIEDALRDALAGSAPGDAPLTISPELSHDFLEAVAAALTRASAKKPVIVTSADLRRHVRELVQVAHPRLAVLSYGELLPEIELAAVGHVGARALTAAD